MKEHFRGHSSVTAVAVTGASAAVLVVAVVLLEEVALQLFHERSLFLRELVDKTKRHFFFVAVVVNQPGVFAVHFFEHEPYFLHFHVPNDGFDVIATAPLSVVDKFLFAFHNIKLNTPFIAEQHLDDRARFPRVPFAPYRAHLAAVQALDELPLRHEVPQRKNISAYYDRFPLKEVAPGQLYLLYNALHYLLERTHVVRAVLLNHRRARR